MHYHSCNCKEMNFPFRSVLPQETSLLLLGWSENSTFPNSLLNHKLVSIRMQRATCLVTHIASQAKTVGYRHFQSDLTHPHFIRHFPKPIFLENTYQVAPTRGITWPKGYQKELKCSTRILSKCLGLFPTLSVRYLLSSFQALACNCMKHRDKMRKGLWKLLPHHGRSIPIRNADFYSYYFLFSFPRALLLE